MTFSPEKKSSQFWKVQKFLNYIPESKKASQSYLGSIKFQSVYVPRTVVNLNWFLKLLKAVTLINITTEFRKKFDSMHKAWNSPPEENNLVLTTDSNFWITGRALTIEVNPERKKYSKRKTFAHEAFGTTIFSRQPNLKFQCTQKSFLTIYIAFFQFVLISWEPTRPTIVLTDKISSKAFRQEQFHYSFGKHVTMRCNLTSKKAHTSGSVNIAGDILFRLELNVTEWLRLKIWEDIQTTPIQVTTLSSDVTDEE